MHLASAIYPHVTFGSGTSAIFGDFYSGLISLTYITFQKLLMESVVEKLKISFRGKYGPVSHYLPLYIDTVSLEFLLYPVQRHSINILAVKYCRL